METEAADLDALSTVGADGLAVAPSVVAVVVAHDPGEWFEECLRSLAEQEYPSLSVLVVDAASDPPLTPRVAAVLPSAYVRRLEENPGPGAASNEVLRIVEGAPFYLLCHDDVVLDPGAVRALVEEAYRSNAGVVGPKLVAWDDPGRLLQVGVGVDKTGHEIPTVERGELDQEQHDAVRDVFCVPGAVTLVRADLFAGLGGYDPDVTYLGEDLDLCWRAQVAGARVLVAPAAVVRHLEALGLRDGFDPDTRRRLHLRHRLRSVLTCYGPWHRARVLPQLWLIMLIEVVYALAAGRRRVAGDVVDAWRWNRRHRRATRAARARVAATRAVPDSEVRRLQSRGSARLSGFVRGTIGRGSDDRVRALTRSAGDVAGSLRRGPLRTTAFVCGGLGLVLVAGSRHLLWSDPAVLVDLPAFPVRPWPVLGEWLSGWNDAGLGSEAPQPTAYGLLGVAGTMLFASMGLLQRLLVVGPLVAGPLGAARLAGLAGSRRAALVAAVAYAAIPLPYDALAEGRWGGALVCGAAPWLVVRLARPHLLPLVPGVADVAYATTATPRTRLWRDVLGLGVLTAALSAFVPLAALLPFVVALALVLGGLLAGEARGSARIVGTALGATAVALVLHLPWSLELALPGATWAPLGGATTATPAPTVAELLRFETGPIGGSPLSYAVLLTAALPLVIGRSWRLTWAVRGWTLALVAWAVAVAAGSDAVDVGTGPIELLLAPGAAGLALAAGLGVAAFEGDLRGYRFGWRQGLSGVAAVALAVAAVPVVGAALDGRWDSPARGATDVLAFLDTEQLIEGASRTLWLGDAAALPLAGWDLGGGTDIAWGLTDDGTPTILDRWAGSPDGTTLLVADALHLAAAGETSRLLSPMAIRYVVVVETDRPVALSGALTEQLDLAEVEVAEGMRIFRNDASLPMRAAVDSPDELVEPADRYDAEPVLVERDAVDRYEGELPAGAVWTSTAAADGWSLEVGGRDASPFEGFGWGNAFVVDEDGPATLEYSTPLSRRVLSGVQAALWIAAAYVLVRTRARRSREPRHAAPS